MCDKVWMWGRGVKIGPKQRDVLYGRPLWKTIPSWGANTGNAPGLGVSERMPKILVESASESKWRFIIVWGAVHKVRHVPGICVPRGQIGWIVGQHCFCSLVHDVNSHHKRRCIMCMRPILSKKRRDYRIYVNIQQSNQTMRSLRLHKHYTTSPVYKMIWWIQT